MILFEKDIYENNAYIDVTTRNSSFIKMSKILRLLGIENNKFFLSLLDRDLLGRDPHNLNDPSIELRLRIGREAKLNVWYFLREVCKVQAASGDGGVAFELNRFNLALYWNTFNNIDTFNTILRQVGKTTGMISLQSYLLYIRETNYQIGFMSKDADGVQECVKRTKTIRDLLPSYLVHKSYKDGDNKEGLTYEAYNNQLLTFIAQKSAIQAKKQARGMSLPFLGKDEFGFQDNNHIMFPSAVAATTKAREQAIEKGGVGALCIATTAADPDTAAGGYAFKIKEECMLFQDKFYDCKSKEELMNILSIGSIRKMFYITYNHRQLGKSDEWLRDTIIRVGCTEEEAARDYYSIWQRGSRGGALPPDVIKVINDSLEEPKHTEIIDGFVFNYYVELEKLNDLIFCNKPFILGMDSSENIGQDYSTLFMIDPLTMMPIMSFRCNSSNLNRFAKMIFVLMLKFKRMIWIPERNHVGAMIVDTVIDLLLSVDVNPFERIYNTEVNDAKDIYSIDKFQLIAGNVKSKFGFRTHGGASGRRMLYDITFEEVIKRNKDKIKDSMLIDQLRELIRINGRIDHAKGKHDDMVIAYLLSCYFVFFAKNINFYGISSNEVIDFNITIGNESNEIENTINKEEYLALFKKMKELESKIECCSSLLMKYQLESDLRELKDYLKLFKIDEDILTRQQLVENINDQNSLTDNQKLRALQRFTSLF